MQTAVFTPVVLLGGVGLVLLLAGVWAVRRRDGVWGFHDPVSAARALWALGFLLLILAILVRPANPDTAAFPPPGSSPRGVAR